MKLVPPERADRAFVRVRVPIDDEAAVVVEKVEVPVTLSVPEFEVFAKRAVPVKVGEIENTALPVPVSSVSAVSKLLEVKEPSAAVLPTEVIMPVRLAFVVTLLAVKALAVPVMFVPTRVDGVPRFGVVNIGEVVYATTPVPDSSERRAASWAEVVKALERPRVEVANQVGTPPTTERISPAEPIVRLVKVLAADA